MNAESETKARLRDLSSHFAFGENWAEYARTIDPDRVALAEQGLVRLLGQDGLRGRTFFDIGSGSGLHAAAAARLGATRILAVDIDPNSVATSRTVLGRYAPDANYEVRVGSVFELPPGLQFDIVYSWGVLHHTGDMWHAIDRAASFVKPGGALVIAIYGKTPMCGFWKVEKRVYSSAPAIFQTIIRSGYKAAMFAALAVRGRDPFAYVRNYRSANRGMNWHHDVHDWLGGYPYESATPDEVKAHLSGQGFGLERMFGRPPSIGLFGTGCYEYVFQRAKLTDEAGSHPGGERTARD